MVYPQQSLGLFEERGNISKYNVQYICIFTTMTFMDNHFQIFGKDKYMYNINPPRIHQSALYTITIEYN